MINGILRASTRWTPTSSFSMRRISQRKPKTCQPCARRKIRCSRTTPYTHCVRRKIPEQCVAEQVILSKALAPETTRAESDPSSPSQRADKTQASDRKNTPIEAASALDSLIWGSHQSVTTPPISSTASLLDGTISPAQEQLIMDFHWNHVAWMHNVLHMPSFITDCQSVRHQGSLPDAAWLSCYYAVLASTLMFINQSQKAAIRLSEESDSLAQGFYKLTLETIHATDTMTPSIHTLQAICIVMPCAHAFGDNKRIITLLSSAISIAQTMGLHQLGPDSSAPKSPVELIRREVCKRIWSFLAIQDAYLITFKRAYMIHPRHVTTPEPVNCIDNDQGAGFDLPLSVPTRNSFIILLKRMTDIQRELHDSLCSLPLAKSTSIEAFEKTLAVDEKLSGLIRTLPPWLALKSLTEENASAHSEQSPYQPTMTRSLKIAGLHLRIKTNRPFFLKGLTSRLFYFSTAACIESARSILRIYLATAATVENEVTTTQAHVITACIILTLRLVHRHRDECDLANGDETHGAEGIKANRRLILSVLDTLSLKLVESLNLIAERGVRLVRRLLGVDNELSGQAGLIFGEADVEHLAAVVSGDEDRTQTGSQTGFNQEGDADAQTKEAIPNIDIDDLQIDDYLDEWLGMVECDPGFGLQYMY